MPTIKTWVVRCETAGTKAIRTSHEWSQHLWRKFLQEPMTTWPSHPAPLCTNSWVHVVSLSKFIWIFKLHHLTLITLYIHYIQKWQVVHNASMIGVSFGVLAKPAQPWRTLGKSMPRPNTSVATSTLGACLTESPEYGWHQIFPAANRIWSEIHQLHRSLVCFPWVHLRPLGCTENCRFRN